MNVEELTKLRDELINSKNAEKYFCVYNKDTKPITKKEIESLDITEDFIKSVEDNFEYLVQYYNEKYKEYCIEEMDIEFDMYPIMTKKVEEEIKTAELHEEKNYDKYVEDKTKVIENAKANNDILNDYVYIEMNLGTIYSNFSNENIQKDVSIKEKKGIINLEKFINSLEERGIKVWNDREDISKEMIYRSIQKERELDTFFSANMKFDTPVKNPSKR